MVSMNKTNLIAVIVGVSLASATLVMATVGAGPRSTLFSPDDYEAAGAAIGEDTRLSLAGCKKLTGAEKLVCTAEARSQERIRRADLEARYLGTFHATFQAQVTRVDAQYEVGVKRCEAQGREAKGDCQREATEQRATTLAALRRPS